MKSTLQIVVGLLIVSAIAVGKGDLVQQFYKKYNNLQSVSCEFESNGNKGSLSAVLGGRYRIEMADRTIISDGRAVYNIQYSTKTAVINSYEPTLDDISIEKILFIVLNVYKAEVIRSTSRGVEFRLTPQSKDTRIAGVDKIDITCSKQLTIKAINIYDNNTTTTWLINNLKLNQKVLDSRFKFSAPKGWQIVDLR